MRDVKCLQPRLVISPFLIVFLRNQRRKKVRRYTDNPINRYVGIIIASHCGVKKEKKIKDRLIKSTKKYRRYLQIRGPFLKEAATTAQFKMAVLYRSVFH